MSESDITLRPDSGVVWPAMKQPRGHIGQQLAAHRFAVEPADSGYPAHMTSASIVPAVTFQLKALGSSHRLRRRTDSQRHYPTEYSKSIIGLLLIQRVCSVGVYTDYRFREVSPSRSARREQCWGVTGVTRVATKQSCRQTLDGPFCSRQPGSRRERFAQLRYIYIFDIYIYLPGGISAHPASR